MVAVGCLFYVVIDLKLTGIVRKVVLFFRVIRCFVYYLSSNVLCFYVGYEAVMLGLLYLILRSSGYQERLNTVKVYVVFTVLFSIPFLIMVFNRYVSGRIVGVSLLNWLLVNGWLVAYLIFGFIIKVPVWGFHFWLPLVHVEAPVSGSILLAGVMIKMGAFGLYVLLAYLGLFA